MLIPIHQLLAKNMITSKSENDMAKTNKLEKLYQTVANCEELRLDLPNGVIDQITAMEEQLIKDEVLPLIHDNIEPTLKQVKRPLVLVVEYAPKGALRVNLSRKVNITAQISDAKEITPDPIVEHTEKKKGGKKVVLNPRTRLRITMPDGHIIEESTAQETLRQFILSVGVDRVRAVGLKVNKVPLVSNTIDPKYKTSQKSLGRGWYLMTCSDTATKKRQIETIATAIGIDVNVDIV